MDPLVSNITDLFREFFQADIISCQYSVQQSLQPIGVFGTYSPLTITGGAYRYELKLIMAESPTNYLTRDAHTVAYAVRNGFLEPLLRGCGVLTSVHSQHDTEQSTYRTVLNLTLYDMEKFTDNVSNFKWNLYSTQFDQLMDKKLTED